MTSGSVLKGACIIVYVYLLMFYFSGDVVVMVMMVVVLSCARNHILVTEVFVPGSRVAVPIYSFFSVC